jgi:hypothetical protein
MSIRKAAEALVGALNGSDKDAIAQAKAELERELCKRETRTLRELFDDNFDDRVTLGKTPSK